MWAALFESERERIIANQPRVLDLDGQPAPEVPHADDGAGTFRAEEQWDESGGRFFVGCWIAMLISGAIWTWILWFVFKALGP